MFVLLGLLTYMLVNVTWVFFRAKTFSKAWQRAARHVRAERRGWTDPADVQPDLGGGDRRRSGPDALADARRTLESVVARTPAAALSVVWALMAVRHRHRAGSRQCLHLFPVLNPLRRLGPLGASGCFGVCGWRPLRATDRRRPARGCAAGSGTADSGQELGHDPSRFHHAVCSARHGLGDVLALGWRKTRGEQYLWTVGPAAPAHRSRRRGRDRAPGRIARVLRHPVAGVGAPGRTSSDPACLRRDLAAALYRGSRGRSELRWTCIDRCRAGPAVFRLWPVRGRDHLPSPRVAIAESRTVAVDASHRAVLCVLRPGLCAQDRAGTPTLAAAAGHALVTERAPYRHSPVGPQFVSVGQTGHGCGIPVAGAADLEGGVRAIG